MYNMETTEWEVVKEEVIVVKEEVIVVAVKMVVVDSEMTPFHKQQRSENILEPLGTSGCTTMGR